MNEVDLSQALKGLEIPRFQFFERTGSSNDVALTWAANGAPDGALVIADEQTQGRGRMNRQWVTVPGAALAFSLIFRPGHQELEGVSLFSALAGVAVQQALEKTFGLPAEIKWPNDMLVNGKKLCGVLVESVWMEARVEAVVVGIGVNVAPSSVPAPEMLLFPATCVETEAGRPVERLVLLREILKEITAWRKHLLSSAFYQLYSSRLAFQGQWVKVSQPGDQITYGRLKGVGTNGCLLLESEAGDEIALTAGDVHLRLG